jgi:hypothetical protein
MARTVHIFNQRDVTRALRGAANAGMNIDRVEIGKDKIVVFAVSDTITNDPRDDLDRELSMFEARHGEG